MLGLSFASVPLYDLFCRVTGFGGTTQNATNKEIPNQQIYIAGGGRKNNYLLELLKLKTGNTISLIDTLGYNGDFIESQTFAYLAIRSLLKLPISFPETTGCHTAITGGQIIKT